MSFVIGGAIGNVTDRLLHGAVVDFLYFHLGGHYCPPSTWRLGHHPRRGAAAVSSSGSITMPRPPEQIAMTHTVRPDSLITLNYRIALADDTS